MKNTVTITLDDAKISALKMYLAQKNSSLNEELTRYAEQLYGKIVPQNVREFIELSAIQKKSPKPRTPAPNHTEKP